MRHDDTGSTGVQKRLRPRQRDNERISYWSFCFVVNPSRKCFLDFSYECHLFFVQVNKHAIVLLDPFIHLVIAPLKFSKCLPWSNEPTAINESFDLSPERSENLRRIATFEIYQRTCIDTVYGRRRASHGLAQLTSAHRLGTLG